MGDPSVYPAVTDFVRIIIAGPGGRKPRQRLPSLHRRYLDGGLTLNVLCPPNVQRQSCCACRVVPAEGTTIASFPKPRRLSAAMPGGDEPMAGHFVIERLARDLQVRRDLPDVALMTRQGFPDQFGLIGLDTLDQAFVRRGEGR